MKNYIQCSNNRWLNKEVLNEAVIFDGKSLDQVLIKGQDKYPFTVKIANSALQLTYDTNIANMRSRPAIKLEFRLEKNDYSMYNRIHAVVYFKAEGIRNLYCHFSLQGDERDNTHAPSIQANKWVDVVWEINDYDLSKIPAINFVPFVGGCPPEATSEVTILIKQIKLEQVEPEYELGYKPSHIAYCHVGYFTKAKKEFIVSCSEDTFSIISNEQVILTKKLEKVNNDLGEFSVGDFSEITDIGSYQIKVGSMITAPFVISNEPYKTSIDASLEFLYQLRCGEEVEGVHSACHLQSVSKIDEKTTVPNFGGWHDAGDLSQFEICTAEMTSALLDLALTNPKQKKRILEEAKVGLNWLLRTTFKNGSRALAVSYDRWYDNVHLSSDMYPQNVGEDGPFENFIASNALALGYIAFKKQDPLFASWCLRTAISDFEFGKIGYEEGRFTKRWGPSIPSQTLGSAATAAATLYKATKDQKYIDQGSIYLDSVIACQAQEYPNWDIPIRGFFYEDLQHEYTLTYEHRGHESSPVCGLVDMLSVAPNHANSKAWRKAIDLYKEYILATIDMTSPYNFLIGHVYELDKINIDRFTVPKNYGTKEEAIVQLKEQVKSGIKLGENAYARRLPIAIQRRGFHATLLAKTEAVSSIAKLLKDDRLLQIAIDQLEWIMGKNPFASSTMYGVGNNFHPLYVAYSNQMYGALPVGFKTLKEKDEPYWPTQCNAVFKEVWGHTTGKYLAVLADIEGMKNDRN